MIPIIEEKVDGLFHTAQAQAELLRSIFEQLGIVLPDHPPIKDNTREYPSARLASSLGALDNLHRVMNDSVILTRILRDALTFDDCPQPSVNEIEELDANRSIVQQYMVGKTRK